MPILEPTETLPAELVNPNDVVSEPANIQVNLDDYNINHILTHLDGSKWILNAYYSQYVSDSGEVSGGTEAQTDPLYQQYLKIKNMEVRVISPLAMTYNPDLDDTEYEGEAYTLPGIVPNTGDVLVVNIGVKLVEFNVIEVTRMTAIKQPVWKIRYRASHDYVGQHITDLESKVVKTTIFVMDYLLLGKYPLLVDSEYAQYNQIENYLDRFQRELHQEFYARESNTLLIPDQEQTIYDPIHLEFIRRIVSGSEYIHYRNLTYYNCDNVKRITVKTVHDAVLERDANIFFNISPIFSRGFAKHYPQNALFSTIAISVIDELYYPKEVLDELGVNLIGELTPSPTKTYLRTPPQIILPETETIATKLVTVDEYYIFSETFYTKDANGEWSMLENLVNQYIEGQSIDVSKVLLLCEDSINWGSVERFYYLPFIIVLLRSAISEIVI